MDYTVYVQNVYFRQIDGQIDHTDNQTNRLTFTIVVFTGFRWTKRRDIDSIYVKICKGIGIPVMIDGEWTPTRSAYENWLNMPAKVLLEIKVPMYWLQKSLYSYMMMVMYFWQQCNTTNQQIHGLHVWFSFICKMCGIVRNFLQMEILWNVIRPIISSNEIVVKTSDGNKLFRWT